MAEVTEGALIDGLSKMFARVDRGTVKSVIAYFAEKYDVKAAAPAGKGGGLGRASSGDYDDEDDDDAFQRDHIRGESSLGTAIDIDLRKVDRISQRHRGG